MTRSQWCAPQVTIAYSHVQADAAPYAAALGALVTPAVSVPVTDVALIRQERPTPHPVSGMPVDEQPSAQPAARMMTTAGDP